MLPRVSNSKNLPFIHMYTRKAVSLFPLASLGREGQEPPLAQEPQREAPGEDGRGQVQLPHGGHDVRGGPEQELRIQVERWQRLSSSPFPSMEASIPIELS